jgi:nucleoside-diphosphate-sugar epimerase
VSSLSVLGLPRTGAPITEETPYPPRLPDPYSASKRAAELLVLAANEAGGLETTVVRPGVIWGPGDITIVPRLVELLRRRQMILIDGGRNLLGLSHIESLSRALVLAAESPRAAGQIYHVTDGEEITAREAVDALAEVLGVPRARVSLPLPVVYAIAALIEGAALLARRPTPPRMTRYGVRLVACHCRYDIGKARRDLGYRPAVTFRDGIRGLAF